MFVLYCLLLYSTVPCYSLLVDLMDLDAIPVELFDLDQHDAMVTYLLRLPIPTKDKEYIFIAWSKEVGYSYSHEDIKMLSTLV